jgi:hypothetical protein
VPKRNRDRHSCCAHARVETPRRNTCSA